MTDLTPAELSQAKWEEINTLASSDLDKKRDMALVKATYMQVLAMSNQSLSLDNLTKKIASCLDDTNARLNEFSDHTSELKESINNFNVQSGRIAKGAAVLTALLVVAAFADIVVRLRYGK